MPTVPTYDNLRTSVQGAPDIAPRGPGAMQLAGQQLAGLGDAMGRAGNLAQNLAIQEAQQQQQVQVIGAMDQLKQEQLRLTHDKDAGFTSLRGDAAIRRPEGKRLADEFGGMLQQRADGIAQGLGSEQARLAFKQQAAGVLSGFRGQAMQHEAGEFRSYSVSMYEGSIGTAKEEIALSWNRPDVVEKAVGRMRAAAFELGKLQGKAADFAELTAKRIASDGHTVAIAAALDAGALDYAQGYLKKFSESMEANDILRAQGLMAKALDGRQAQAAVQQVMPMVERQANPTDFDRMVALTLQAESGGRRYGPDGKTLLTSPKGAKGEMQVLDGTNKDPGFGVRPAKDDSPDERARVGRDYLAAMLKRYGGDTAKAWAAYNAGPGALDEAIMRAGSRPGGDWLTMMPAETQAYVTKNVQRLQSGERPPAPTLQDVQQALDARMVNASPEARAQARQLAGQQWTAMQAAQKQRDDEAVAGAMRALQANGGRFSDLPPSVRASLPPKEVDGLMNYAARLAKGDDTTNPKVYQVLSDPQALRSLSEAEFYALRRELSQSDWQRFADQRKAKPGGGGESPGSLDAGSIKTAVDEHLVALKIDPTPKSDGGNDAARVGVIRKFVTDEIARAQAMAGKKFSDVEIRQHVGRLFASQATVAKFFGSDTAQQMLRMKGAGDIPADARKALRDDFKRAGITDPTDAQLLGAYWTMTARTQR